MSRSVEICIRGCQNFLFGNVGHTEHPDEKLTGKCVTDDDWKYDLLLEEPLGSMLTAQVHVFSDSVFCTGGSLDALSASDILEQKAESVIVTNDTESRPLD